MYDISELRLGLGYRRVPGRFIRVSEHVVLFSWPSVILPFVPGAPRQAELIGIEMNPGFHRKYLRPFWERRTKYLHKLTRE